LALLALALSSAAAVDQYTDSQAFCADGGGCAAVRASVVGRLLGDALPWLGLLGFGAVVGCSLATRAVLQRVALAAAASGGLAGLALVALQLLVVGRVCSLCLATDLTAVVAGGVAALELRRFALGAPLAPPPSPLGRWLTLAGLLLAALGPPAWFAARPPQLPPYVLAAIRAAGNSSRTVVVELSDFECPYCRAMHPVLSQLLAGYGERVRLVRKSVPLPGHPHAFGAAMAFHCAADQGRGEVMADVLFTSEALGLSDCVGHARALALDVARFERCLAAPETRAAIEHDVAEVRSAGLAGLPTVYVGTERIIGFDAEAGAQPYADALARAAAQ
jgi:protein-disulfide isomerase/uncharacterized membrane protein